MNRVKREFCSKGQHPTWRAWDISVTREAYCLYCKCDIAKEDRAWPLQPPNATKAGLARSLYELKKIGYWKKSIFIN